MTIVACKYLCIFVSYEDVYVCVPHYPTSITKKSNHMAEIYYKFMLSNLTKSWVPNGPFFRIPTSPWFTRIIHVFKKFQSTKIDLQQVKSVCTLDFRRLNIIYITMTLQSRAIFDGAISSLIQMCNCDWKKMLKLV